MLKIPNRYIAIFLVLLIIFELATIAAIKSNFLPLKTSPITAKVATTTGIVSIVIQTPCTLDLKPGWNLISICANLSNNTISNALGGSGFQFVLRWNETTQTYEAFSSTSATNPFDTLEVNRSYFVFMPSAGANVSMQGNEIGDLDIGLIPGWNAPGYPYLFSANISNYTSSLSSLLFMLKWDASTQSFQIFSIRSTTSPFSRIFPGEGQFLFTTASETLRYNKTELENS